MILIVPVQILKRNKREKRREFYQDKLTRRNLIGKTEYLKLILPLSQRILKTE